MIDVCDVAEFWNDISLPALVLEQQSNTYREIYRNEPAKQLLGEESLTHVLGACENERIGSFLEEFVKNRLAISGQIGENFYSVVPMQWNGRLVCMLQDVTGQRRKDEELVEAAQSASRAKTRFLSEMSHDIRTPMNAIMGMTEIAMSQPDIPVSVGQCLEKIQTASTHLMSLLNEVLDISRIESGRLEIHKNVLNVGDMVHEILIVAAPQADAKKLDFCFEKGVMERECIFADGVRLKQIFLNLLSNAVKFTPEGGKVRFHLAVREVGEGQVRLYATVQDNGIGMSPEFLEHVFVPFERERCLQVEQIQGTGLGMAITKKLVERMGGEIKVKSARGEGTCFTLEIPFETLEKEEEMFCAALGGERVLFLTGDRQLAGQVGDMLARIGVEMECAASGKEVLAKLGAQKAGGRKYFAFLTVEQMAQEETLLLLPQVRSLMGQDFPVLMLSEGDWDMTSNLYTRAGVSGCVPLPLFGSSLFGALYDYTGAAQQKKMQADAAECFDLSGCHLMLVEDNELNREIALALLADTKAAITTAENGRQAVEMFADSQIGEFDLILMDIQMPVLNGLDATREIRKMGRADARSIPIVAMTANAFVEDVQNSLNAGMDAHISKPIDMKRVVPCLQRFLKGAGR